MAQVQQPTELQKTYVDELKDDDAKMPINCDRLVFHEPWNSRAFGLAIALDRHKVCAFEDFRQSLITTIDRWEKSHEVDDPEWEYYEQWLTALETLAVERGLVTPAEIDERVAEFRDKKREEVI